MAVVVAHNKLTLWTILTLFVYLKLILKWHMDVPITQVAVAYTQVTVTYHYKLTVDNFATL